MAELAFTATEAQDITVARSVGTAALGASHARLVIETSGFGTQDILRSIRKIEADIQALERTVGAAAGGINGNAFADGGRFADASTFADQNSLGL